MRFTLYVEAEEAEMTQAQAVIIGEAVYARKIVGFSQRRTDALALGEW
jgi:hypothetical protein